jgi:hypothetical protein
MVYFSSIKDAFSSGGNRLCFVDPNNDSRCIKIARPERAPEIKRAAKSFPGNMRSLAYFDENVSDMSVYKRIQQSVGDDAYALIPKCYGFVDTNLGLGLSFEMIKDCDKQISMTLKQYVWQYGLTVELNTVLEHFMEQWQKMGMPSRNLLLHNIVVQQDDNAIQRLVVIDGLGWPDVVPFAYYFKFIARYKAKRKTKRLPLAIYQLLAKKEAGGDWGLRGWMESEQRNIES